MKLKELIEKLYKEFEEYFRMELDADSETYLKKQFKQAFLKGKIEGLKEAIAIKEKRIWITLTLTFNKNSAPANSRPG